MIHSQYLVMEVVELMFDILHLPSRYQLQIITHPSHSTVVPKLIRARTKDSSCQRLALYKFDSTNTNWRYANSTAPATGAIQIQQRQRLALYKFDRGCDLALYNLSKPGNSSNLTSFLANAQ